MTNIISALANAVKTTESHQELKVFLDEFLRIEEDDNVKSLVLSIDQTEIRINSELLELRIGKFGASSTVTLDNTGHITISDAFGNTVNIANLQRRLTELPIQADNYEDETGTYPDPPSNGNGSGGNVSSVFGRVGAILAQQGDYDQFYATPNEVQTIARNSIDAVLPLEYSSITGELSLDYADSFKPGALLSSDWNTFNNKCNRTGTSNSSFQFGTNGLQLATIAPGGNRTNVLEVRTNDNSNPAKLKSSSYGIGEDIFIQPVANGQSVLGAYWGLQIGGLRGRDFYDTNWNMVEPNLANIESSNSSCVVIAPTATQGNSMPNSFTTLSVFRASWQTSGLYQKWFRSNGATDASLDLNGDFFCNRVNVGIQSNPVNARFFVQGEAADRHCFSLQASAAQSAAIFTIRNSDGTTIAAFRGGGIDTAAPGSIALGTGISGSFPIQVVGTRKTGWSSPPTTGATAPTRTALAAGSTTDAVAARVNALIQDLIAHGLIGA